MVTEDDARSLLQKAHQFVNGDPSDRIHEFFLVKEEVRSVENDEGEEIPEQFLDVRELPFHNPIMTELNSMFVEELFRYVSQTIKNETKELLPYHAGNMEKNKSPIQFLEVGDLPDYEIFDPFTRKSGFEETSYREFSNPDFQVYRVRDRLGRNMFVGFRKFTRKQVVGSSWKVKVSLRDSEYDMFEDDVYALPEHFDAFVLNDTLFVKNQRSFEDIFDYFTAYNESAENVFASIEDSVINIHNMELFRDSVKGDRNALRKMVAVEERALYDELTREDVETVVEEFRLNVDITEIDGEWGIVLPSRRDKLDLIKLFNDDHMYSALTDVRYQALGKNKVE